MQKIHDIIQRMAGGEDYIDIFRKELNDADVAVIAKVLKHNHTLRVLYLGDNQITDAGVKDLASALKDNHTLISFDLDGNQIADAGAKDINDINNFLARNQAYRKQHDEALKYLSCSRSLVYDLEINEACLSSLNEALNNAKKIIEDLEEEGYNQAPALFRTLNTLHAIALFQANNIHSCLDIYINQLQPQPPEALSFKIVNLILDKQPLDDPISNQKLILMCLRGTTNYNAIQYNALQELRGIIKNEQAEGKGYSGSQPLNEIVRDDKNVSVTKIVSVLDVSKPNNNNAEFETCVFYEELALIPKNPTVHTVHAGEIPDSGDLDNQFEAKKKELLQKLLLKYPENPDLDMPSESTPFSQSSK